MGARGIVAVGIVSKPTKPSVEATERRASALDMRRKGLSYTAIGEALGVTQQAAHALVQRSLQALVREPGEDVIALERERLDVMHASLAERIEQGELAAIDRGLAIMQRRARLDGLDKATDSPVVNVTSNDGPDLSKLSPDELRVYWTTLARAARTEAERARFEAAAAALGPRVTP